MGILDRLSTLIKSNVNDVIDSMQDPGKEIDQMVLDLEDSARKARAEVATCMAEEKRLAKRIGDLDAEAQTWESRATAAVKANDDALAKEALRRKAEKVAERMEAEKALQEQKVYVDQLTAGLKALDARVRDVKSRQGTLREKARAAKNKSAVSTKTSAFDEFERMSGKIDAVEAEASLNEELSGETPEQAAAGRKLETMSADKSVDDALAELKKKLGGG
jgi:phage shock protein A